MTPADRSDLGKLTHRRKSGLIVLAVLFTLGLSTACWVGRPSWIARD